MQRSLGFIIHPAYPIPLEHFGLEFEGGLKTIDDQAQCLVHLAKVPICLYTLQPDTAHRLANDRAILLFDMRLVIFDS